MRGGKKGKGGKREGEKKERRGEKKFHSRARTRDFPLYSQLPEVELHTGKY